MRASVPSVPTLLGISATTLVAVLLVGLAAFDVATFTGALWWAYRRAD